jgi:murein DD-endopeptidase MepM/ murein hydrolase activator NlpD
VLEDRDRPRFTRSHVAALVLALVALLATTSTAQVRLFPTPTPRRTPTPAPTPTQPPSPSPTVEPEPTDTDIPLPTDEPDDTPRPKASPSSAPVQGQEKGDPGKLPPELEQTPQLVVPVIPRTRPRNTARLVDLLEPLTRYGFSLEQVLVEGMGRFPVAGVAYYRDDWLHPRYTPTPHLHKGLDIFADFGTPIRSPDKGVVTRLTNNPAAGGIGTWIRGSDGTAYYFAHQLERVEGIYIGMPVDVGTVIGFVGDTGNAQGGASHLHFEIHRGGGPIPPKPSVDKWLDEAIELAPRWVEAKSREIEAKKDALAGLSARGDEDGAELEASMLLTLLDPVGGSVGLLPQLQVAPSQRRRGSSGVLAELIRLRLDGYLFVPSSQGLTGY